MVGWLGVCSLQEPMARKISKWPTSTACKQSRYLRNSIRIADFTAPGYQIAEKTVGDFAGSQVRQTQQFGVYADDPVDN